MVNGNKTKKVCLMGVSLATYNMGVSALTASLVKIFRHVLSDVEFSLLIGNRSSAPQVLVDAQENTLQLNVVNYRLSPKARYYEHILWIFLMAVLCRIIPMKSVQKAIVRRTPFLHDLVQADYIGDIRGGDSFSDIYGLPKLIVGSMPAIIALLMKKDLILLPQTYGPYDTMPGRAIARYIIGHASRILSRDRAGIGVVSDLMGNGFMKDIIFCPDVAFMLDSRKPRQLDIEPQLPVNNTAPLIGFNINGLMYNGGFTRKNMFGLRMDYRECVRKTALSLLENTNARILFIPHTYNPAVESDPDASRDVMRSLAGRFGDRMHLVTRDYDQSEIKGVIKLCNFFIGSRMHACIAAISQEIPTVGIAYSRKFHGVFESVGVGEMIIDGRSSETDDAVKHIMQCYQDRDEIKMKLRTAISKAKKDVIQTFQTIST